MTREIPPHSCFGALAAQSRLSIRRLDTLLYMYLKDRCNKDGQCYPAIGTIARELQLSCRTVEWAISDLVQAGLLTKEQRWRKNGGRSSLLYTLKKV